MIFIPTVFVGKPADLARYEKHASEGLTVYLPKDGIYDPEGVVIRFTKEDGNPRLRVEGLKTIPRITKFYQAVPTSKARRILKE